MKYFGYIKKNPYICSNKRTDLSFSYLLSKRLYITLSHIASVRGKSVAYLINKLFSNYFPEALQAQHSYFKLIPTSSEGGDRPRPDHSLKKQQILNIMKSFKIMLITVLSVMTLV